MDFGLKEKVAIITGGARGIGYADASALGAEGARIAINDLDAEAGATAVAALRAKGIDAECFAGDATDEATVKRLVDAIALRFG
ncbi:MAG: SDR family NAD(P)-dependent oxidoreductase, partial [Burkholderiales bacterium]